MDEYFHSIELAPDNSSPTPTRVRNFNVRIEKYSNR